MLTHGLARPAVLKGSPFRDCFISFPQHWRAFVQHASVTTFMVTSTNSIILVSWSGRTHEHDANSEGDTIYISSRFMKVNGFCEKDMVFIQQVICPPPCDTVTMILNSLPEWKELLLNLDVAQDAFLSQVRVVRLNQILPLWLEGGTVIYMKAKCIAPNSDYGLLQYNTTVEVHPLTQKELASRVNLNAMAKTPNNINISTNHEMDLLFDCFAILKFMNSTLDPKEILLPALNEINFGLRYVPYSLRIEKENILNSLLNFHPSLIIIGKQNLKHSIFLNKIHFVCKCRVEKNDKLIASKLSSNNLMAIVLIWEPLKKILLSNFLDPIIVGSIDLILKHTTCIISIPLIRRLSLTTDHIIVIKSLSKSVSNDTMEVDVSPMISDDLATNAVAEIKLQFKNICSICPIIINDMTVIYPKIKGNSSKLLLMTRNKKAMYVDHMSVFMFSVNLINRAVDVKNLSPIHSLEEDMVNFRSVIMDDRIMKQLKRHVLLDLNLLGNDQLPVLPQFALLQGSSGSGKTFIVENLLNVLSRNPYFVYCEKINMKQLKGKKVDSIQKLLKNVMNKAVAFQPSLIIIDDLDVICSVKLENDIERDIMNDNLSYTSHLVKNMLYQIIENSLIGLSGGRKIFITVIATCKFRDSINSHLSSPKGKHIFPKSFQISPMHKLQKYELLKVFIHSYYGSFLKMNCLHKCNCIVNYNQSCTKIKIETLSLTDISNIARRIFLEGQSRWTNELSSLRSSLSFKVSNIDEVSNEQCSSDRFCFTDEDFEKAFQGFIPLGSKVLKLPTNGSTKKEVGGLIKAKEALEEMLLWPSSYPTLFGQATLSPRSGILLYGPPGCGKTLLANSFAYDAKINFIVIKGPELLSKYIGQSEKAVREVFQRALDAKPSILFFDEFESIAPKRGHDSTGVTDRVVNQLLTQMDGAEGLFDIFVLAATSRPELIDPALLRPGRLDKSIFCPIPNEKERLEILQALSNDLLFDKAIDFKDIALHTKDFTGADLQSLLSTAQVKAAQESIGMTLYKSIREDEINGDPKGRLESTDSDKNVQIKVDSLQTEIEEPILKKYLNSAINTTDRKDLCNNLTVYSEVVVMKKHINEALAEVKPSVSASERAKYEALHQMFNNTQEIKVYDHSWPGRRETLA